MVFAYLVTITLRREEDLPAFLKLFEPLRQHCSLHEPNTLTYEILRDESCPRTVLILERYRSVADLETTHRHSKPFKDFCDALGPLDMIEKKENVRWHSDLLPSSSAVEEKEEAKVVGGGGATTQTPRTTTTTTTTSSSRTGGGGALVFCGSKVGVKSEYATEATHLGAGLAKRNKALVYGGGTVGVMGALAHATHDCKGSIYSVIPRALLPREVSGESLGEVLVTETMSERKSVMFSLADVVIALPGGIGTFDELLEVMTLYQLNAYRPRIGLVNVKGFFDPFLTLISHLIEEGFLEPSALAYLTVKSTAEELLKVLLDDKNYSAAPSAAELQWTAKP